MWWFVFIVVVVGAYIWVFYESWKQDHLPLFIYGVFLVSLVAGVFLYLLLV